MKIISGRQKQPFNVIMMGVPGVGKSTWAQNAPDPLFIGAENNGELEAKRLVIPKTFAEFTAQLLEVITEKPAYQTLVIDTLDSIEKLLHGQILGQDTKSAGSMSMAHGGYGRAYEKAEREMITVRSMLQTLRDDQGKNIIILCHSMKIQADDTVLGLRHDSYELAVHRKVQAIFVDWVSCVLFATYKSYKVDDDNSDRVFAIGQGERVVLTTKHPGYLAKNRFGLPKEMPLEFEVFYHHYMEFYQDTDKDAGWYLNQCMILAETIQDETLKNTVGETIAKSVGDKQKLRNVLKRIEERLNA